MKLKNIIAYSPKTESWYELRFKSVREAREQNPAFKKFRILY